MRISGAISGAISGGISRDLRIGGKKQETQTASGSPREPFGTKLEVRDLKSERVGIIKSVRLEEPMSGPSSACPH